LRIHTKKKEKETNLCSENAAIKKDYVTATNLSVYTPQVINFWCRGTSSLSNLVNCRTDIYKWHSAACSNRADDDAKTWALKSWSKHKHNGS